MSNKGWKVLDSQTFGLIEPAPFTLIGPYLKTRKLIRSAFPLWTLNANQIKQKNLLNPLAFNVFESICASAPVSILLWFIENIIPDSSTEDQFVKILEELFSWMSPVIVPLSFLVLAYTAGWSALRKEDYSKAKSKISKNAYLYLDGAYGLLPQAITSFLYVILIELLNRGYSGEFLLVINLLILFCSFWLLQTSWCTIRSKLFAANGYNKQRHGLCLKYVFFMSFWGAIQVLIITLSVTFICWITASVLVSFTS